MTTAEFRSNPIYTTRMREILEDPVVLLAFEAMRDSNPVIDPDPDAPEIASVRFLSQMMGYQTYPRIFQTLGTLLPPTISAPEATFPPEE